MMDFIRDIISEGFSKMFSSIRDEGQELYYQMKMEIWKFEKRVIKGLMFVSFLALSFVSLSLALLFFIHEYLNLTFTLSFLIIGVILAIVGIILKL